MTKTKTKITKQILCVMLCFVTAFCTLPMSAFAGSFYVPTNCQHTCDNTLRYHSSDFTIVAEYSESSRQDRIYLYQCNYCGEYFATNAHFYSPTEVTASATKASYYWYKYKNYYIYTYRGGGENIYTLPTSFRDVIEIRTNATYKGYWKYLTYTSYYNSYLRSTSSTTFSPEKKLTISAAITILYRMAGSPSVSGSNPFKDVSTSDSYYKAALWAYKKGITTSTTFNGTSSITREKLITFAYRFVTKVLGESVTTKSISSFSDASSVSSWAKTAMKWAYANGIISGSNGKLNPSGTISRINTSKIVYKVGTTYGVGRQSSKPCSHSYKWVDGDALTCFKEDPADSDDLTAGFNYSVKICTKCSKILYFSQIASEYLENTNLSYFQYCTINNNFINLNTLINTKGNTIDDSYEFEEALLSNSNSYVTYASLINILYCMADYPYYGQINNSSTEEYYLYMPHTWAYDKGLTTSSRSVMKSKITREQAITILYRYVTKVLGKSVTTKSISSFSDASKVSSYAKTAMKWAYANGIISGSSGKLNPSGYVSINALYKMIYKVGKTYNIGNNSGTSYFVTKYYDVSTGKTISQNILF